MTAKAGRKPSTGRLSKAEARQRVIRAAFDTLRTEGYSGTSARAIAATGGFDQALVFYHFGSVNGLLLAALADSSATQLGSYEEALAAVTTPAQLLEVVSARFEHDMASGHVKVLAELVAASAADRELADAVGALVDPWLELTQRTIQRLLADTGLGTLIAPEQAAFAIVALFLGVELLVNLKGDATIAHALLRSTTRIATLFGGLLGGSVSS